MRVLVCLDETPAGDGSCAVQGWAEQTLLPTLSIADGREIGLAIALLWGAAWGVRMCMRALREIG